MSVLTPQQKSALTRAKNNRDRRDVQKPAHTVSYPTTKLSLPMRKLRWFEECEAYLALFERCNQPHTDAERECARRLIASIRTTFNL